MKALKDGAFITTTKDIQSDEEAIEWKMKMIHPKLFGLFCPTTYTLVDKKKVYVPYEFLQFSYVLKRGKGGFFDRKGQIGVVFDMNEVHAFHFDLFETLSFVERNASKLDGQILEANCTKQEALEQSLETVKWQYLRRVLHTIPEVNLISRRMFYRSAYELALEVRGKRIEKYAYLDNYGAENEHVSGLKVRLDI